MHGYPSLLATLARALNDAGIPYMVIGGQAVIHHGEPRFTKDVDLTLCLPPFDLQRVLPVLESIDVKPAINDPQDFVNQSHLLPCFSPASPVRVDLAFTDSPYEQQAIARGVDVQVEGVPVRFASVEDLLIHKLIAWRPLDQKDIETILLKNPNLDLDDVRHWCAQFEQVLEQPIVERLEQALRGIQN